jgi:hypothetical protein
MAWIVKMCYELEDEAEKKHWKIARTMSRNQYNRERKEWEKQKQ